MAKTNPNKRSAAARTGRATAKTTKGRRGGTTKSAAASRMTAAGGKRSAKKLTTKGKVGSSTEAAKRFGGKLDFGTPSRKAHPADHRVKVRDDVRQSQRNGPEGQRVVGVSAVGYDPGHSGGAADTDIIGVGTPGGSSVSTDGTLGRRKGKDLTTSGGSAPFASGPRSKNKPDLVGKVGGNKRVRGGTTHSGVQDATTGAGSGDIVDRANEDQTIDPLSGGPARSELGDNFA